jgi:PilZ domain
MSTPGRAPLRAFAHRRAPRCALAVPVRVTLLRSGTAYSVTGRALNLGEGGIAISLADDVRVSDSVAVEFLLPDLGLGLQARAVVRYHANSQSGLEFRSLTRHQQAVIREWTRQQQSQPDQTSARPPEKPAQRGSRYFAPDSMTQLRRLLWPILALLVLVALIAWWRWERAWKELEDHTHQPTAQTSAGPGQWVAQLSPILPADDSIAVREQSYWGKQFVPHSLRT